MKHSVCVVLLAGCSWMGRSSSQPGDEVSIEPPAAVKGDLPFSFSNSTDRPMCSLQIDPVGTPPGPNWIRGGIMKNGASKYTKVRAGEYHLVVDSCEKGKYHSEGDVTITRKTDMDITFQKYVDENHMAPDPNVDQLHVIVEAPDYILHPAACVANEQPTQFNGADCCAAAYHTNNQGVRVCGA